MMLSTFFNPFLMKCKSLLERINLGINEVFTADLMNILFDLMGCFQIIEQ